MTRVRGAWLALALVALFPVLCAAAADATDLYAVALSAVESGEFSRAATLLESALEQHPEDARLHWLLGVVYRQLIPSRPADAVVELQKAHQRAPGLPGVVSLLVELLQELDRAEEAESLLRVRLQQAPSDFEALRTLGALLLQDGRNEEGEVLLHRGLEVNPQDGRSLLVLGQARLRRGEPAAALEPLERARALLPGSPKVRYALAQAYQGAGRTEDGRAELQVYLDLQKEKQRNRDEGRSHGLMMHAIAVHEERLLEDAVRPAGEYRYLAGLYHISQNGDRGREFFRRLAREQGDLALPLLGEALLERRAGRAQIAWELLLQGLERQSEDPVIITAMIKLVTPTRGQELLELLEAMGSRPDPPPKLPLWLGVVAMNAGRAAEAQRLLLAARESLPDDPEVLLNLGVLQARQGRLVPALGTFRLLTDAYPTNGPGWFNRALVELRMGQGDMAAIHLQRALDAGEVNPRALNLLARLLVRQGRTQRAADLLLQSLDFKEDQPEVRRMLEGLRE